MGIYPTVSNSLSWVSDNTEGSMKRAIAPGMVVGWGNLNDVVASNVYLASEAPRFWTGHTMVLAFLVVFLLGGSLMVHFSLAAENRKRWRGERDNMLDGLTPDEILVKGDKRPDIIYILRRF
jgi:hypothetical protein